MIYEMTELPDHMRVDGICTVLVADYMKNGGIGEAHDFPELIYIAKGETVGILDGDEIQKHEGQLMLIAPGSFHKKKKPTESEGWIISFASESPLLADLYNRLIDLDAAEKKALASLFALGRRCFTKRPPGKRTHGMVLSKEADACLLEIFKKRLELFLLDLHRHYGADGTDARSHKTAETERVCRLLRECVCENLTVEEIAALAGISVSKLKLLFREKGGAVHCFIRLKIERAKQMMQEGEMNLSEIADALGFASLHYFSRTFKTVTGVSPSQFRQLI